MKARAAYGLLVSLSCMAPFAGLSGPPCSYSEASLREAINIGGTITFGCSNEIRLTSPLVVRTNVVLDAGTNYVAIDGQQSVGLFHVVAGGELTLQNVRLVNGRSNSGSAISNAGTTVVIGCLFSNNWAYGANGAPGTNGASGATVCDPHALGPEGQPGQGGGAGESATGGAIYNSGFLRVSGCTFRDSGAKGGDGGDGGNGGKGGDNFCIDGYGRMIPFFGGNGGNGAQGGGGGDARGGAIYSNGQLLIQNSRFFSGYCNSGAGGSGGAGGLMGNTPPSRSGTGGNGGRGGVAGGACIYNASAVTLVGNSFWLNYAAGGRGGTGGGTNTYFPTTPGNGGEGGRVIGGAIYSNGQLLATNNTIWGNSAAAGSAGEPGAVQTQGGTQIVGTAGRGGNAFGGGIFNAANAWLINNTIALNGAYQGPPSTNFYAPPLFGSADGGNIASLDGTVRMGNTILSHGLVNGWPTNYFGTPHFRDLGHNISSDATCPFTNASSRSQLDARLGPFRENGGPTESMELLEGSPAIDAGDDALAPATDQRGRPRPAGTRSDIGAVEQIVLLITRDGEHMQIIYFGFPGHRFHLQYSADLKNWTQLPESIVPASGQASFTELPEARTRFFRVAQY